ncbi:MAG: UDP-glucose/GDP-mannose dehydrogenase family protein [Candidatus Uhrbacteria bacterium]|nr:UDP-glucose/GDP-mannose dehydrogenase family protein [Candidatus Uhrbacteria bacterium]
MRVTILGTGYVGLTTGASLADISHDVTCVDIDDARIAALQAGRMPFFEAGLEEQVCRLVTAGRLQFTSDAAQAVSTADVVICAVGTPSLPDGSADLRAVQAVAAAFREYAAPLAVLVVKSTVPPGTCDRLGVSAIAHIPEFLRQGSAVADAEHPDRIVVGCADDHVREVVSKLVAPFITRGVAAVFTDVCSAEVTKYAANAFLATKISFINEIANFCEAIGANVVDVARAIGLDQRIGPAFLRPGVGYGGSCFPKDVQALVATGESSGYHFQILPQVHAVNQMQRERYYLKLLAALGGSVAGRTVAIWGLAFKPGTDDVREAPSLYFIDRLLVDGATVVAHDPLAMPRLAERYPQVRLLGSALETLEGADIVLRLTDDPTFPPIPSTIPFVDGRL